MKKGIIIFALIFSILFIIWFLAPPEDKGDSGDQTNVNNIAVVNPDPVDLVIGERDAPATIIEYADFKCPSCAQFHQDAAKELKSEYINEGNLKIIFRPMAVIGPDSERAAIGAYCANDQGKFVEFHDDVFDYMWDNYYQDRNYAAEFDDVLSASLLQGIAVDNGLEPLSFSGCLNDQAQAAKVANNQSNAQRSGVRGTPTFIVNDQIVSGPQPFNVFRSLVELQL